MKLIKQFSLYTIVGFLNAGIGFLILPILTHYLTPADYGIISLVNTYVTIFIPIIGLSTASLISVEYYNKKLTVKEFRSLFSSVILIPFITLIPFLIVFILGSGQLPAIMELPEKAYWLILPLTLFALMQDNFKSFLVVSKRAYLFSIATLSKIGFEIPLTILFIVYASMNWDGRILAWMITVILFSCVAIFFYRKWDLLSKDVSRNYIIKAITFGAPLILHQVGKFVINQSDKIFLAKMISIEEMGIYAVGYQVGMVLLIVCTAFSNFFSPFLYEHLNKGTHEAKLKIIRVSYLFIIAMFFILVILTLLTPTFFSFFISTEFAAATQYVFWIGLSYCFWGIYLLFAGYIFFLKKSRILGILSLFNVGINLVSNYYFIKWLGGIGAAYATCISFFIFSLVIAFISNKLYPMPWFAFSELIRIRKK